MFSDPILTDEERMREEVKELRESTACSDGWMYDWRESPEAQAKFELEQDRMFFLMVEGVSIKMAISIICGGSDDNGEDCCTCGVCQECMDFLNF